MDPDTQKMIRETLRLSRENNELLLKMYGAQKRARFWKFIKFLFLISLVILAYYYVSPYISQLQDSYTSIRASITELQDARDRLPF
ncbi:MAG: hypothetical protein QG654_309 [Patescibacteria group bacterium]|nr:hypothetical protein [Patescibacteria group bacterium]